MGFGKHERPNEGATNIWLTPKDVIDALGPFDLDPCACSEPRPWPTAKTHYVESDDGLSKEWRGFVFCNPPYGPHVGPFLKRMKEHDNGIALVFARTETNWFQDVAPFVKSIFFPRQRLTFCSPDGKPAKGNGGAPSCFMAFGWEAEARLRLWKRDGFRMVIAGRGIEDVRAA